MARRTLALLAAAASGRVSRGSSSCSAGDDRTRAGRAAVRGKPDGVHHFFTADEQEFCRKAREYGYGC